MTGPLPPSSACPPEAPWSAAARRPSRPAELAYPEPSRRAPPSPLGGDDATATSPISCSSGNQGFSPGITTRAGRAPSLPPTVAEAGRPERPKSQSGASTPSDPTVQLPAEDLKPLFDFVQGCRACQSQLAVAQQNAADDAAKIAALTRERDAALTAARGGTFWRRLRRNAAMSFAIGAGAGAIAGIASSHQP